jgi:tRNA G46 methylase TrmB
MAELSAMYGTRLFDQPEHAAVKARLAAFLACPGPLGVEIGFDHGMCILDRARRFPATRQLGVELREARVLAAAEHAPDNCLLLRMDARTLFTALLPDASVCWVYLLFPTPPSAPKRALLSPAFAAAVERVLEPGGTLWFASDVAALAEEARALFPWPEAPPPPLGTELSRRERVCRRDGLAVHRLCVGPAPASERQGIEHPGGCGGEGR